MKKAWSALGLALVLTSCQSVDQGEKFIGQMDREPANSRPKGWEEVKSLMARSHPKIGQSAPDFSLRALDGGQVITRSRHQEGRPLVLLFGSYT